jgi:histidinol-phosphate aminotransferase
MTAYHVPAAGEMMKLDAMESPYGLPDSLKTEWLSCFESIDVNRYPDPDSADLKVAIRNCFSVPEQCGLMLGNGSDELIQIIAMLVGGANRTFLAPIPTFSMYQQISIATATQFAGVPLSQDFSIDDEKLFQAIEKHNPACIFFAYPNNPTGNCFDAEVINQALEIAPGLVVVDEAYFAFCQKSFLAEINSHANLLVLRTMSKSGLAGLRLGMMFGNPLWMQEMEKLRLPYNVNCLTQTGVRFYLRHHDLLQDHARKIRDDRDQVLQKLRRIQGVEVFPSEANFLLFRVSQDADRVYEGLLEKGILIKNLNQHSSWLRNCLRVTIGAEHENDAFLGALQVIMKN